MSTTVTERTSGWVRISVLIAVLAVLALAVVVATRLAAGTTPSTALVPGAAIRHMCMNTDGYEGHTYIDGMQTFDNTSTGPVTLTDVDYQETGFTVIDTRVINLDTDGLPFGSYGLLRGSPPSTDAPWPQDAKSVQVWQDAEQAVGAVLEPTPPNGRGYNLVVSVQGREGSGGPLRVTYRDTQGVEGVLVTNVTFEATGTCP